MSKPRSNTNTGAKRRVRQGARPKKRRRALRSWLITLVVFAALAFLTRLIVFEPIRITSNALNGYTHGDVVLANKLELYTDWQIARGDVVLASFPGADGRYVRRVAGMPGDVIETVDGTAYLVCADGARVSLGAPDALAYGKIPDDAYLLLADNPNGNPDGRNLGLASVSNIKAKMGRFIWPLSRLFRGE